jgi:MFS family permease
VLGWFADRSKSRQLPLLLGLIALGGATVLLCLGSTITLLVVGRLLQGISAAVVWTVGLALLVDTVGQDGIGQAMGYVTLSMSFAVLTAPLLGGVVYEKKGYYSVFAMAFGLIALDIILRLMLVEKKIANQWSTTNDGVTLQEVNTEQAQEHSARTRNKPTPGELANSLQVGRKSGFLTHRPPIITMLTSRRLLAALWGCLVQAALMTSFDSVCSDA